jgi:flagellar hook-length control protein FliK
VREALDQSANRLRELFESQGLDLVDVDVGSQEQSGGSNEDTDAEFLGAADETADLSTEQVTMVNTNLVDSYA